MPGVLSHLFLGACIFIVLFPFIDFYTRMVSFLLFLLASILPDLDNKQSKIRSGFIIAVPAITSLVVFYTLKAESETQLAATTAVFIASMIFMEKLPLSHRGKNSLHQFWVSVPISVIIAVFVWAFGQDLNLLILLASCFLGYLSHLVIDRIFRGK